MKIEDQLINLFALIRFQLSNEDFYTKKEAMGKFIDENSFLVEEILNNFAHRFCVMSPAAGPWYIHKDAHVSVYERKGLEWFQLTLHGEHNLVGLINFVDKKCGIDNLRILIDIYFEEYLGIEQNIKTPFELFLLNRNK